MKVPLCRHIKTSGAQCRGTALSRQPFCYFHNRLHKRHAGYRFTPATQGYLMPGRHIELCALEDRESVQLALSQVVNALATGGLEIKHARALLYGLKLAASNARGLDLAPDPYEAVRDVQLTSEEGATAPIDLANPGKVYDFEPDPDTSPI